MDIEMVVFETAPLISFFNFVSFSVVESLPTGVFFGNLAKCIFFVGQTVELLDGTVS